MDLNQVECSAFFSIWSCVQSTKCAWKNPIPRAFHCARSDDELC